MKADRVLESRGQDRYFELLREFRNMYPLRRFTKNLSEAVDDPDHYYTIHDLNKLKLQASIDVGDIENADAIKKCTGLS